MIINNINPNLLTIGPFSVRFYGIVYAFGFLFMIWLLRKLAREKKVKDLTQDRATDLALYTMIGIIIGARIGHVLFEYPKYIQNPLNIFKIWNGGMAFIGGLIGAFIVAYRYCRKNDIRLLDIADPLALYAPLVLGIGRIANFINGELYGKISNLPWAVNFNNEQDAIGNLVYRHPSQLYELLFMLLLFVSLFMISKRENKKGYLLWSFVWIYGLQRFIAEFYRYNFAVILGLSPMQYISIAMIMVGGYFAMSKRF